MRDQSDKMRIIISEYGFQEEVDDCDVIGEEPEEPEEPFDLAEQRENDRQAIQILQKIIPR